MCQNMKETAFETELRKLAHQGAEFLIGSCNSLNDLRAAFADELTIMCSKFLCDGHLDSPKFRSRLQGLEELFEQAVVDETIRLEYFCCNTCDWWCWQDDRSTNPTADGDVCEECHPVEEDE